MVAAEWQAQAVDPTDPAAVARFYATSEHMADDLADWHAGEERRDWTRAIVEVARGNHVRDVLDVGCGGGHDLRALAADRPGHYTLIGVEPNEALRRNLREAGYTVVPALPTARAAEFDLAICIDVLEHVPHPAAFLAELVKHVRVGGLLVEATATHDVTTPLHLEANWGWAPDGALLGHGFVLRQRAGRFRVWQRLTDQPLPPSQSAVLAVWRSVEWHTCQRLMELYRAGWNMLGTWNDGLIPRARNRAVAEWWRSTPDDVFLMIDGDIVFQPQDAMRLVERCRSGYDVIAGTYAVRDGSHLAGVVAQEGEHLELHRDAAPVESLYVPTGFLAVHRRVIDALIATLPVLDPEGSCPFWDLFPCGPKGHTYLSEDYGFCERVRAAGFPVWTDPSIRLGHLGAYMWLPEDIGMPRRLHQERVVYRTAPNPAHPVTTRGPFHPALFEAVSGMAGVGATSLMTAGAAVRAVD